MFDMLSYNILNPRVIHKKGESNGTRLVPTEAWIVRSWAVPKGGQMFGDPFVGYHARLGKSIKPLTNFQVDIALLANIL